MRRYPQRMINVAAPAEAPGRADGVWRRSRRAEAALGLEGRVLVRASGTEPLVRVMVEAETEGAAQPSTRRRGRASRRRASTGLTRSSRRREPLLGLTPHVRHRGLCGARRGPSDRPRRSPAAGIPRVRLRGRRRARRRPRGGQARRQAGRAGGGARTRRAPSGSVGMGHTRWATHGAPTDRNAHPHLDCSGRIAVIHNGIVENFQTLRARLEKDGHTLVSETDTEGVAHLIEETLRDQDGARRRRSGRRRASSTARTRSSSARRMIPTCSSGVKVSSPLVVGRRRRRDAAGVRHPGGARPDDDRDPARRGQVVEVRREGAAFTDLDGDAARSGADHRRLGRRARAEGRLRHFMRKEIDEQPAAIRDTLVGRIVGRAPDAGRAARSATTCCARSTRCSSSRAAPRSTRGSSPSTRSSTGPACRSRSRSRASSATATRCSAPTR